MSNLDRALASARVFQHETNDDETMVLPTTAAIMAKYLLAEHERANKAETVNSAKLDEAERRADANAADARRWRAVRGLLMICEDRGFGPYWWLGLHKSALPLPRPATIAAAADVLADQQEAPAVAERWARDTGDRRWQQVASLLVVPPEEAAQ